MSERLAHRDLRQHDDVAVLGRHRVREIDTMNAADSQERVKAGFK